MNPSPDLIPNGVWPVMLTAFQKDYSLDWRGIEALTEFYLEAGVDGLFAVAQSAEMFGLTPAERVDLAKTVVTKVDGRVPVVAAGAFGPSLNEQVELIQKLFGVGVTSVVLLTNQLVNENENEDVFRRRTEAILSKTGTIPLGLYECPSPYKRILSVDLFKWVAETGRFVFYKDTCLSLEHIEKKIRAAQNTSLKFFNAELNSLSTSLKMGGNGFSGIAANFYPDLLVRLCHDIHDRPEEAESLQNFLSIAEAVVDFKYPVSAKYFLQHSAKLDISTICRLSSQSLSEHEQRTLQALADYVQQVFRNH